VSKIIRLQATNYKRLKAVEITPDGNIVQIAGKNGAGKSSVLDAITAALGGVDKRKTPKPIRDGEDNAEIVLETDELVVTRRFTPSGSTLTVSTHDGAKFPKGQAKLDDLLGKLSLDPFAFTMLSEKDQLEQLLQLVDLPFDPQELEQQRKDLYDQRAEIGRKGKAIGEVEVDDSLPGDEQSAGDIITKIQEANNYNQTIQQAKDKSQSLANQMSAIGQEIEDLKARIESLKSQSMEVSRELDEVSEVASQDPVDTSELDYQLSTVEKTNAQIRANNDAKAREVEKQRLRDEYQSFTEKIAELDQTKADGLAKAEMPVDGLGFDEHGVTFENIPFKQTNTASQIRVSFAMAVALNPKLRVIRIAEGSLLDDDNMKLIADMAEESDMQVWIEKVGSGNGTGIVIEDGSVKA
jgi:ABC-type dipeptide/oligopeptide/nickel transport system ATPase component